jgi:hypothetical protein
MGKPSKIEGLVEFLLPWEGPRCFKDVLKMPSTSIISVLRQLVSSLLKGQNHRERDNSSAVSISYLIGSRHDDPIIRAAELGRQNVVLTCRSLTRLCIRSM